MQWRPEGFNITVLEAGWNYILYGKKVMRYLILTIFVFSAAKGFSQSVSTLEPAQYFDFWVGVWNVEWEQADGERGKGTNTITKTLDDVVIREEFRVHEGTFAGMKGTSISVYNPQPGQWKQAWADNQGGFLSFTGAMEGEKRIFQTEVVELEDGRRFTQRMVFYNITEKSITWDWETSNNGGESWALNWRIFYTRMFD